MSEIPAAPLSPPPSAAEPTERPRSLLEVGGLITLAALAFAALAGVAAVVDSDSGASGFGQGFGVAFLIAFTGATVACAFACLTRERMERVALAGLVFACLAVDLTVLGMLLGIEDEAYAKVVAVVFVWSFFALVVLGLALAVPSPDRLAGVLYAGTVVFAVLSALVSTWLVLTADNEPTDGASVYFFQIEDDALFQVLGALLVLLATFWLGALAASRLPDQTLKRMFSTSPSSTT